MVNPPLILEALGPFDLDPCAAPNPKPWRSAVTEYTLPDQDGLALPWSGMVWLNPPYSNNTAFMQKMAQHNNGIVLVFARTEAAWFQEWVFPYASALYFLRGRLKFCKPDGTPAPGNAGAPSVFIAYGQEAADRLEKYAQGAKSFFRTKESIR